MKPKPAYFTTKTAKGGLFCNRQEERLQLKRSIEKGEHTVIVAPRRYGKTSLVHQSLHELKVDCSLIDLFCVVSAQSICDKIVKGVSVLINKLLPFSTKTLKLLESCFQHVNVSIKASAVELNVNFSHQQVGPVEQIIDALTGLEKIAQQRKKRVVVFIDEFQDLLKADSSEEIQAAIRTVAQCSEYVCFIFSGSSRNMLRKIFEDRNQPLYMLCHKIQLEKISAEDFTKHLQKLAQKQWHEKLSPEILDLIFMSTECHPYYVNLLCDKLWDLSKPPTEKDILKAMEACLEQSKDKLIADLAPLNSTRIKVLGGIALRNLVTAPTGKQFLEQVNLALGTVQKARDFLLDQDYIYRDEKLQGLKLVDPLLKKFIIEQLT